MAEEKGVWRTVSGRRVFIKDGESLSSAMKKSGKFKGGESKKTLKGNEKDSKKSTEITEQGNSNRKEVREKIQEHIMGNYDNEQEFIEQMEAMKDNRNLTSYSWGKELAKGGNYLIYNDDMSNFLDELKINPKGKKFNSEKSFEMYTNLIARESDRLYRKFKEKNK